MTKSQIIPLKMCQYIGKNIELEFNLSKKKMLIGRFEGSDIHLDIEQISHYHAFIILQEDGSGKIVDMASDNGVFINNKRVETAYFFPGDIIRLGTLEFVVEEIFIPSENVKDTISIQDDDAVTHKVDEADLNPINTDLPPLPGLVLIDGEYCDITFDESDASCEIPIPIIKEDIELDYIDTNENKEYIPILRRSQESAIEVLATSNGHVLSVDYFLIKEDKNKTYYISSQKEGKDIFFFPLLETHEKLPFIICHDDEVIISKLPDMQCFKENGQGHIEEILINEDTYKFEDDGCDIFFYRGTVKVTLRRVEAPPHMRPAPFFGREKAFQVYTAKVMSGIISGLLLLLLVDTTTPLVEEETKIAVIYREAPEDTKPSEVQSSEQVADQQQEQGIKQVEQPKEQVRMAKKSPPKAAPQKMPETAAPEATTPEIKGYKFELKSSIASLAASDNKVKKQVDINKNARGVASQASFDATSNNTGQEVGPVTSNDAVGTLGSDDSGSESRSTGARGLSSKKGINTSYIEPKTIVLGSMDPELLRKILQEYLPQFRHCYQRELDRNEESKGVVDLEFRIEKDGKVSRVDIKGKKAKFSGAGVDCMARVLRMIDFPKPKGGGLVDVKQPLNFFSEKQKI